MAKKSVTATAKRVSTPPPGFGLRLSGAALTELRKVGIRAQQNVSLIHQRQTQQWVLRGEESGGAVPDLGHYVGFVGRDTESLLWSQRVQTIVPNSIHRFLIAPVLIRYEMYRFCSTYDLLISLHWVEAQEGNSRPTHQRKDLFVGRFGKLDAQLWTGAGAPLRGNVKPQFFGRSGEEIEIPEALHDGIYRITEAACCLNCKHSHFLDALNIALEHKPSASAEPQTAPKRTRRKKPPAHAQLQASNPAPASAPDLPA